MAALEAEGIEVRQLSFEEGGHYVGRRVAGRIIDAEGNIETAYIGGPRRPGAKAPFEKARWFDTEEEALQLGYRYLEPEQAMQANLTAAGRRIADKRASDYILSQVPYRTGAAPVELMVARDFAAKKLGRATTYKALIERTLRGEKIPEASLHRVAASFPDEVAQLRAAFGNKATLRDLRARAGTIIGESRQEFYAARSTLTKAKEQARVAHLGEAGIQAPAFAGKFFSAEEADAINKALGLAPLPLWGSRWQR